LDGNLRNDVRGRAEAIKPNSGTGSGHPIRSVTDQTGTEQRSGVSIVVFRRQGKAERCVRDGVFGVAAVNLISSVFRARAEILALTAAEFTHAARPSEPRDADAITVRMIRDVGANRFDTTNDLVSWHDWYRGLGQIALDDVEIGAADPTREDFDEDLFRSGLRRLGFSEFDATGGRARQCHHPH
jgi:hypothetical protein